MEKSTPDTSLATYIAGMNNISRLKSITENTIAGIEKSALQPILDELSASLSGEWEKLFASVFSFESPGSAADKKWNMQEALVLSGDPVVITIYTFTLTELKEAGFKSVMNCLNSLKTVNAALGGNISVKSMHELVGVTPEHVGEAAVHLYFEIGSCEQRAITRVKINRA
ncbi:MAG: hypothetical protein MUD00_03130 [Candidatus Pacebacteria bacterium]|jgi:hypothetical protein|nr:hypothetical protein [Candidatus Paceibacterota bacterium]